MGKFILRMLICYALILATAPVFAVWPPSGSMDEDTSNVIQETNMSPMTISDHFRFVVQKLEEDEHDLAVATRNLEKDEEALKNLSSATETDTSTQEDSGKKK